MRPLNLVCISRDGLLHSERRITSAHGMTLEGCPGGEDLIGKVLGRITLGRGKAGIVGNGLERNTALGAEPGCGRHLASAVGTGPIQRSGTLLAELRLNSVLVLALRAFHCR